MIANSKRRVDSKIVAQYIGCSDALLRAQRHSFKRNSNSDAVPFYKIGRRVVYDLDEVDQWLASHRFQSEHSIQNK